MPFAKRGAYPSTDHRNEKQAMSKDQTQKIQDLAKRLIEELHALGGDILTTVVVTQNQQLYRMTIRPMLLWASLPLGPTTITPSSEMPAGSIPPCITTSPQPNIKKRDGGEAHRRAKV